MIEFAKKIKVPVKYGHQTYAWAKHNKVGTADYDVHGKYWEVGEDINFDKFWFREIKDKDPELEVKGFRKND